MIPHEKTVACIVRPADLLLCCRRSPVRFQRHRDRLFSSRSPLAHDRRHPRRRSILRHNEYKLETRLTEAVRLLFFIAKSTGTVYNRNNK